MTDPAPSFSVIIPTFDRLDALERCLDGVARLDYPRDRLEVIVVDDGSPEPCESIVDGFRDRFHARYIRQSNAGPAAARNTAAAEATGEYLAFTDDDCIPSPKWLRALASALVSAPPCLAGGRVVNIRIENAYSSASQLVVDLVYAYYNWRPHAGRFFASNNLALPAGAFRALGGFDAGFRTSEDRDLCARWLASGGGMIYAEDAVVSHGHQLTWRTFCRQHFEYGRGAFRYHHKNARTQAGYSGVDLGFYAAVIRLATRRLLQLPARRAAALACLLVVWQIANTAGWAREAVAGRRRESRQPKSDLGPFGRTVAAMLGTIWIAAAVATLVLAFDHHRWLGLVFGAFGTGYGALWIRVAQTGRRLQWRRRRFGP